MDPGELSRGAATWLRTSFIQRGLRSRRAVNRGLLPCAARVVVGDDMQTLDRAEEGKRAEILRVGTCPARTNFSIFGVASTVSSPSPISNAVVTVSSASILVAPVFGPNAMRLIFL